MATQTQIMLNAYGLNLNVSKGSPYLSVLLTGNIDRAPRECKEMIVTGEFNGGVSEDENGITSNFY